MRQIEVFVCCYLLLAENDLWDTEQLEIAAKYYKVTRTVDFKGVAPIALHLPSPPPCDLLMLSCCLIGNAFNCNSSHP